VCGESGAFFEESGLVCLTKAVQHHADASRPCLRSLSMTQLLVLWRLLLLLLLFVVTCRLRRSGRT
jgi:hypothetical protein